MALITSRNVWIFMMLVLATPIVPADDAPFYVGYEGCKMCHRDHFADWVRSKHAKTFDLLKPGIEVSVKKHASLEPDKDYTTSDKCLKCHVTGYEKPGGFVDIQLTPTRAGVGCEMCHGPGSRYRKIHKQEYAGFTREDVMAAGQVYGSVDEAVCESCHANEDMPMSVEIDEKYQFELEDRLKKTRSFHRYYD